MADELYRRSLVLRISVLFIEYEVRTTDNKGDGSLVQL